MRISSVFLFAVRVFPLTLTTRVGAQQSVLLREKDNCTRVRKNDVACNSGDYHPHDRVDKTIEAAARRQDKTQASAPPATVWTKISPTAETGSTNAILRHKENPDHQNFCLKTIKTN
jgi:hypothetical protein